MPIVHCLAFAGANICYFSQSYDLVRSLELSILVLVAPCCLLFAGASDARGVPAWRGAGGLAAYVVAQLSGAKLGVLASVLVARPSAAFCGQPPGPSRPEVPHCHLLVQNNYKFRDKSQFCQGVNWVTGARRKPKKTNALATFPALLFASLIPRQQGAGSGSQAAVG